MCVSLGLLHYVNVVNHNCIGVVTPDVELCKSGIIQDFEEKPCQHDIHICSRGFNISYVRLEPFTSESFRNLVENVISYCCGSCRNTVVVKTFNNMTEISPSSINSSHVLYPILGRLEATSLYGYYFVPFWNAPGAYYITTRRTKTVILKTLITSCGNLWPLLIIMLLMSLIAGFIVWIIDTWGNKEMFPRTFLVGLLDGFWWSFISMTTVGYGDKIPKLFPSRLFSVIWILVGITICSMFTASLTTEITHATTPGTPEMAGKPVGVIKQRYYDYALVSNRGGIIKETKALDLVSGVIELIINLKNKQITGFSA